MIPFAAAVTAAHADPVAASTSACDRPLYIVPSQKMWHGESTWVTVLPWNVMPSRSDEKPQRRSARKPGTGMSSAPGMSAAHGHVVVDRFMSSGTATSHAQDTLLPWLHERNVALIGADTPQDVQPSGYEDVLMPVHAVSLVAMGLWLLDNCDLEVCATTAAGLGQWDFHLAVAPVRFAGTSGSPVNPIATF